MQGSKKRSRASSLKKTQGRPKYQRRAIIYRNPILNRNMPGVLRSTGTEIKAVDLASTSSNFLTPATGATFVLLNGTTTGSSFYNRIGSKIEMKSLRLRGQLQPRVTTNFYATTLRLIIFYDRQANGAVPSTNDVVSSYIYDGTNSKSAFSDINLNNRDRFVILRDKQLVMPTYTFTATVTTNVEPLSPNSTYSIDEYIKLKGLVTHYKASTGAIGDIATGSLYMMLMDSDYDDKWSIEYQTRLRFFDN